MNPSWKVRNTKKIASAFLTCVLILSACLAALGGPSPEAKADSPNLVVNPGFEGSDSTWTGWTYEGTEGALSIKTDTEASHNIRSGSRSASYWSATAYQFTLSQTITGLADGDYVLTAWSSGDSGNKDIRLFADGFGGDKLETPIVNAGWGNIASYTVEGIHVTNGQAIIGFEVDSYAGKWGFFDDVELHKVVAADPPPVSDDEFIKGADISTLQAIEDAGGKYYENGAEKDLLAILRDHGVNYIRLRLWNDPVQADGYNDKDHVLAMAKRVKEAGLKLLLDFHYSDFWADPGKQEKPAAWASLGYDDLKSAVYDYTADVMNALKGENAYPDMVQIGNEINPGLLLPDGSTSNYDKLSGLLSSGIQAVRDTTPDGQYAKIMLHLAEGGNNSAFRTFFDAMRQRNVDYDVIGMSYYPYWHGSLQQLKTNLNDMAARYGKEVVVAETAYGYTLGDGDGWGNTFGQSEADEGGFPATVAGQKQLVTTVMNTVAHVPDGRGLGVFYWEPAWIPVPKDAEGNYQAGWKSKEGNAWDNQAMFDFGGNALDSLDAFRFEPGDLPDVLPVSVKQPEGVTVPAGVTAEEAAALLPAAADVLYNEGSIVAKPVVWEAIDPEALTRVGTFELAGTVQSTGQTVQVAVTVSAYRNVLVNPGFEAGYDFPGWTYEGTAGAALVKDDSANAYSGGRAVNYYSSSDFSFTLSQTVTDLPDGNYTLKTRISGGGGDRSVRLSASGYGGETVTSDVVNTGWQQWKEPTLASIPVTNGKITIGLSVDAPAGTWGWFDDFELYRDVKVPEWNGDAALAASDIAANQLKLSWSGVKEPGGLAGYKIYQNGRKIATVTDPSYTVKGLAPNTSYNFKVEASYDGLVWTSTGPSVTAATASGGGSAPPPASSGSDETTGDQNGPGTAVLTAADLKADGNGGLYVDLSAGTNAVRIPVAIAERLNGGSLTLRTAGLELRIPQALFKQLEEKLRAVAEGEAITLRMEPVGDSQAESLRTVLAERTGADVRIIGGAYDFALSIASADGKHSASLTEFSEPIRVRFAAPANSDPDTAGIFYLPDEGAPVYVGATLREGYYEANVTHFSRYALLDVRWTFADVPSDHWAYEAIRMLAARQLVQGVGGSRFAPSGEVTRAEFASMLVRALRLSGQESGEAAPFADVPANAWYAADIAVAAANGLIQGRDARTFDPNGKITRQEMAGMAVKAAALLTGRAVPGSEEGGGAGLASGYADEAAIASWARGYVATASAWKLTQGRGAGRFEPNGTVTRAEAVQIAANIIRLGEMAKLDED